MGTENELTMGDHYYVTLLAFKAFLEADNEEARELARASILNHVERMEAHPSVQWVIAPKNAHTLSAEDFRHCYLMRQQHKKSTKYFTHKGATLFLTIYSENHDDGDDYNVISAPRVIHEFALGEKL